MKYLWIGININSDIEKLILDNKGKLLSAKVSQDNWVVGLDNLGIDMDSINSIHFPYTIKNVPRVCWSRNGKSLDINVEYKNIRYFDILSKRRAMVKEAKKWAKAQTDDLTVFVYSMHTPFLAAALSIKKILPNTKIVLLVPDLPQFMDLGMSKIKKVLKAIDWRYIKSAISKIDKFVLYSKHMAEFLGLKKEKWCVLEGSINEADVLEEKPQKGEKKAVMYSGVTDLRYGIPELLDAFNLIEDENYELWITGTGNAKHLIEERAKKDSRIKYLGFLPSRKDLLLKQKEATMLISVRKPEEKASAYCFPSKIFEYMISGNPVLSFEISGIPDEYFEYLVKMENSNPKYIADTIINVANMEKKKREELGESSRQFVLKNKNRDAQAKKLLDFATQK